MAKDNQAAVLAAMVKLVEEHGNPFTVPVRDILAALDMPENERPAAGTIQNVMDKLVEAGAVEVTDNGQRAPKTYRLLNRSSNGSKPPAQTAQTAQAALIARVPPSDDPLAERFGPVRAAIEAAKQRQRELRMEIERQTELYEAGETELATLGKLLQTPLQAEARKKEVGEAIAS